MSRTPNLIINSYGELFSLPPSRFKQFLKHFILIEYQQMKSGEYESGANISDYGRSLGVIDHHVTDLTLSQAESILELTFGEKPGKTSLRYQESDDSEDDD